MTGVHQAHGRRPPEKAGRAGHGRTPLDRKGNMKKPEIKSIEEGTWYYFTVDLNFEGFASFRFLRFLNVNDDRTAALVELQDRDYFKSRKLILLPYTRETDYFKTEPEGVLSVWTFDGSKVGSEETIDLKSEWPRNILDKAAITPSSQVALKWTTKK